MISSSRLSRKKRPTPDLGLRHSRIVPDQAISDLLAILDDRIESEGVQVGLPVEFLHQMWTLCNTANAQISETVWLQKNIDGGDGSKAEVRQQTYHALITFLESQPEDDHAEDDTRN